MKFEDFVEEMEEYQICFYNDAGIYSGQRYETKSGESTVLLFEIKKAGVYYFTINQISKKFFPKEKGNFILNF